MSNSTPPSETSHSATYSLPAAHSRPHPPPVSHSDSSPLDSFLDDYTESTSSSSAPIPRSEISSHFQSSSGSAAAAAFSSSSSERLLLHRFDDLDVDELRSEIERTKREAAALKKELHQMTTGQHSIPPSPAATAVETTPAVVSPRRLFLKRKEDVVRIRPPPPRPNAKKQKEQSERFLSGVGSLEEEDPMVEFLRLRKKWHVFVDDNGGEGDGTTSQEEEVQQEEIQEETETIRPTKMIDTDSDAVDAAAIMILQKSVLRFLARREIHRVRRRRIKRCRVGRELHESEKTVLSHFRIAEEVFVAGVSELSQNGLVSQEDYRRLFLDSGFVRLAEVEQVFVDLIEECFSCDSNDDETQGEEEEDRQHQQIDPFAMIARDVFLPMMPRWRRRFAPFFANQRRATETWVRLKSRSGNPTVSAAIRAMERDPRTTRLGLHSYFLMPLHRLPRYRLLLRDLLRCTEPEHPDYPFCLTAQDQIAEVFDFVDEKVKRAEMVEVMETLRQKFLPDETIDSLFQPKKKSSRRPQRWRVFDGTLWLSPHFRFSLLGKSSKRVFVIVFTDVLVISDVVVVEGEEDERLRYLLHMKFKRMEVFVNPEEFPLLFFVESDGQSLVFKCRSEEEVGKWIRVIHQRIVECREEEGEEDGAEEEFGEGEEEEE